MAPGSAPPYRAAAACPNSWNPPESTVTTNTSRSRCGRSNASYADAASPCSKNTHQVTARNPTTITATTAAGRGTGTDR